MARKALSRLVLQGVGYLVLRDDKENVCGAPYERRRLAAEGHRQQGQEAADSAAQRSRTKERECPDKRHAPVAIDDFVVPTRGNVVPAKYDQ